MQSAPPLRIWTQQFQRHGITYRVQLDPSKAEPLEIFRGEKLVASTARKRWRPWKLEVGDVDGDGTPDFGIGVLKPTRFIKRDHASVFFYTFDGRQLHKKWLGSTVGRPLIDFCIGTPDSRRRTPLWILERVPGGKKEVVRATWSGFGFSREKSVKVLETAEKLARYSGKIVVVVNGKLIQVDLGGLQ